MILRDAARGEKRAFTLVEFLVSLSAAAVLAAAAAAVFFYCIGGPLFICERAFRAGALSEALEGIVEGDAGMPGLRSCADLVSASGDTVVFDSYAGERVTLRFDAGQGKFYRTSDGVNWETLPYYAAEEDTAFFPPGDGPVFRFYDEKEKEAHSASGTARIEVSLCAAGSLLDGESDCVSTSITLK